MNDGTATPQWLFDLLNEQVKNLTGHSFELDAAASAWNAKCSDFFDEDRDALTQEWSAWRTIFCNPPFSTSVIEQFALKAIDAAEKGSTVLLLVPSWPGYGWFQELKRRGQSQDVVGTTVFNNSDGKTVRFGAGAKSTDIVIFTLGPQVVAGMNGPPIKNPETTRTFPDQPASTTRPASAKRLKLTSISEIVPKATEWLWDHRIPLGELTVIDGDPGINKSSFLLDLAARVSSNREMIDGTAGVSGGVILLLGEDSIAKTVRSRLEVAEADLSRIGIFEEPVYLPRDLKLIEQEASRAFAKLIIIDPLMAFLSPDSNSDQKVRTALTPLAAMAERTNAAVVMVRHLNKGGGKRSMYRGSGSIGIIGAARSGLMIGRSPDEPNLRVLCHTKCNLGPLSPSLLFEPVDVDGVPQIEWRGECDYSADDLLGSPQHHAGRLAEAMQFLFEFLSGGPAEQAEIKRQAVAKGMAYRTVERAKEILGVESKREGFGPGSKSIWRLPEEVEDTHSTPSMTVAFYGGDPQP